MLSYVKTEIQGVVEPELLREDIKDLNLEKVEKQLGENIKVYEDALATQEVHHTTYHSQMENVSEIADLMHEIQSAMLDMVNSDSHRDDQNED